MYNYSIKLTYKDLESEEASDTQYRKELLAVFDMEEYTEEILEKQDNLFEKINHHYSDIISLIRNNDRLALIRNLTDKDCFMILFSWDYFNLNHNLISSVLKEESMDELLQHKNCLKEFILECSKK